ncbi:MAG TPA: hypothetical protein VMS22_07895 [Candidatus Eisenbacteria bacterium]|nr:hypothetical protein [Candidatus Eisenbacteria bacterium]
MRALAATLILLGMALPASAKIVCPSGRFTIKTSTPHALDAAELVLGKGRATISGTCGAVRAGQYLRGTGAWLLRVKARWNDCGGRPVTLKAQWDLQSAGSCRRLEGTLRTGGRRVSFVADRIPECGNGVREGTEQCDGSDGSFLGLDCCDAECHVKNCPVQCDTSEFPCPADEICTRTCGFSGYCRPRAEVDCSGPPVCGCDGQATYATQCAAWEAGDGFGHAGACQP